MSESRSESSDWLARIEPAMKAHKTLVPVGESIGAGATLWLRALLGLLVLVIGLCSGGNARADWIAATFSGPVSFGDPISACQYQFQAIYSQAPDYTYAGAQFSYSASGVPFQVQCTFNLTSPTFGIFEAPQLSGYGTLQCPSGTIPTALSDSGCAPLSGTPGSQSGGITPAGQNGGGKDCTDCSVGDPINPATGNEYLEQVDYRSASEFPLEFVRYYNSDSSTVTTLIGANWRHTYDRSIAATVTKAGLHIALANRHDGRIVTFTSVDGLTWVAATSSMDRLQCNCGSTGIVTGWTYRTADDHVETYDMNGRLLQITDRAGRRQTLSYSGQQLSQVSDSYGRVLTFGYDGSGHIYTVTNPEAKPLTYRYDANGNLYTVTYQDNTYRQYVYNESANTSGSNLPYALTGVIDESQQRYETIRYDSTGRAFASSLGSIGANSFSIRYPAAGSSAYGPVITDPLGTQRTYSYSLAGQLYRLNGFSSSGSFAACGQCTRESSIVYDANGFVQQITDPNANVTLYSVDSQGLERSRTEGYGTAQARTTSTTWETGFRLAHEVDEPGRATVYTHDGSNGNLLSIAMTDTVTGTTRTTTYSNYNNLGQAQAVDGPRTDINDVTQYQFDAQGNLKQITDALGHVTKFTSYDAHGNPLVVIDANGVETDLTYDPRQRLRTRTVAGTLTRFDYYNDGDLQAVTLPNLTKLSYSYDTAHRLTDVTDNLGDHIHYTLDGLGNRTQEQTYDPSGGLRRSLSRIIDPGTGWIQDLLGANGQDRRFSYLPGGQVQTSTEITAAANYVTAYQYDALNRLSQVDDATGAHQINNHTYYGYDAFGRQNSVKDPKSLTTSYVYNGLGDLTSIVSPDTGTTRIVPDSAGNAHSRTDARSVAATYTYDPLNRITSVTYPTAAENVTYFYDGSNYGASAPYAIGRLTGIRDQSGTTTYYYNPRGTLQQEIHVVNGASSTISYTYDAADVLKSIAYPGGDKVTYQLDGIGRITEVDAIIAGAAKVLASNIQYLPFGPWTAMVLGNGLSSSRSFDADYRISKLLAGGVLNRTYAYGGQRNNITGITDGVTSNNSQTFSYDEIGELTAATGRYGNYQYSYDGSTGDRLAENLLNSYSYDPASHHMTYTGTLQLTSLSYDAAGNEAMRGNATRTYNSANRLIATSNQGNPRYLYNAIGQRVQKTTSSGLLGLTTATTAFTYDQSGLLLVEKDGNGSQTAEYFWLNGQPLALYAKGEGLLAATQVYYYHGDHLGAPQVLTDSTGATAWSATYEPFGKASLSLLNKVTNNLRLPGQYSDSETGFYQNGYRDYDPDSGRYIESDPIGLDGGINTYAYVGGSPVSYIDPFGLSSVAYNTQTGTLTIYNGQGNIVGTFPAGNNTTSTSRGPWPPGDYDYLGHIPHTPDPNGPYGSNGNFVFNQPGCIGCGVHAGRANKGGPSHKTEGCIRTTDPATELMNDLNQNGDPLDGLYVGPNPPSGIIPPVFGP